MKLAGGLPEHARTLVVAVAEQLRTERPGSLVDIRAEWAEPFLRLTIVHRDGTVLEVRDGDGRTTLTGGGVDYHGRLTSAELSDVLAATLAGRLSYIRVSRLRLKIADHFEIDGRVGERIGYVAHGPAGLLLGRLSTLPHQRLRTRVRFDREPAISASYE